ncbi:uncharacterized protein LOC108679155 [Hyalella azteca]|uniref:TBC1 domain family member 30 n=1 Tax=Hyalella azteca TaxID=294128 RepID=A0A979FL21_HYAAZ|nr:uncharacterized protein LOC108679155 [Hyalella azteca]
MHIHRQRCDMITALLHALSQKRRQDTRMRFSVVPAPGDSGFCQWHSAMTMCARLPEGIPAEFRKRLWLTLAEHQLRARQIDWPEVERRCFNERTNPDDDELGDQIVKDLHRTGCSLFTGDDATANQAMLKRVLLAYSRWNKAVGYCQGFNMLAAIILEEVDKNESHALKVMIYLIEGVLPESYFANNLRGLSVDMAVFRDLLRMRLPTLSRHLDYLRQNAADSSTGTCYEPPLTNVFTMQWFLTLFSNCLPKGTVMRVWDLTFLQGNEVLLRTALALWDRLAPRILAVQSADEFYTEMAGLTREMLSSPSTIPPNSLVQSIVGMAPFPLPGLTELRDRYAYNITPWSLAVPSVSSVSSVSSAARRRLHLLYDDEEESGDDDDDSTNEKVAIAAAFGLSGIFRKSSNDSSGPRPLNLRATQAESSSRPNLDISALKKQYARLRERQKQAHVILAASQINMDMGDGGRCASRRRGSTSQQHHRCTAGKPSSLAGNLTSDMSDFTRSFASNLSYNIASNLTGRSQAHFPTKESSQQNLGSNLRRASVDCNFGNASPKNSSSDPKPLTMNHLLRGKTALTSKTKRVVARGLVAVPPVPKKVDRKRRMTTIISPHHIQPPTVYTYPGPVRPLVAKSDSRQLPRCTPRGDPDLPISPSVHSRLSAAGHPCPPITIPAIGDHTTAVPGPEPETLLWKDANRTRRASLPPGVKLLDGTNRANSLPDTVGEEGSLGSTSDSTSTELCDDDDYKDVPELPMDAVTPRGTPPPGDRSPRAVETAPGILYCKNNIVTADIHTSVTNTFDFKLHNNFESKNDAMSVEQAKKFPHTEEVRNVISEVKARKKSKELSADHVAKQNEVEASSSTNFPEDKNFNDYQADRVLSPSDEVLLNTADEKMKRINDTTTQIVIHESAKNEYCIDACIVIPIATKSGIQMKNHDSSFHETFDAQLVDEERDRGLPLSNALGVGIETTELKNMEEQAEVGKLRIEGNNFVPTIKAHSDPNSPQPRDLSSSSDFVNCSAMHLHPLASQELYVMEISTPVASPSPSPTFSKSSFALNSQFLRSLSASTQELLNSLVVSSSLDVENPSCHNPAELFPKEETQESRELELALPTLAPSTTRAICKLFSAAGELKALSPQKECLDLTLIERDVLASPKELAPQNQIEDSIQNEVIVELTKFSEHNDFEDDDIVRHERALNDILAPKHIADLPTVYNRTQSLQDSQNDDIFCEVPTLQELASASLPSSRPVSSAIISFGVEDHTIIERTHLKRNNKIRL